MCESKIYHIATQLCERNGFGYLGLWFAGPALEARNINLGEGGKKFVVQTSKVEQLCAYDMQLKGQCFISSCSEISI